MSQAVSNSFINPLHVYASNARPAQRPSFMKKISEYATAIIQARSTIAKKAVFAGVVGVVIGGALGVGMFGTDAVMARVSRALGGNVFATEVVNAVGTFVTLLGADALGTVVMGALGVEVLAAEAFAGGVGIVAGAIGGWSGTKALKWGVVRGIE